MCYLFLKWKLPSLLHPYTRMWWATFMLTMFGLTATMWCGVLTTTCGRSNAWHMYVVSCAGTFVPAAKLMSTATTPENEMDFWDTISSVDNFACNQVHVWSEMLLKQLVTLACLYFKISVLCPVYITWTIWTENINDVYRYVYSGNMSHLDHWWRRT